jgi:hypothetical protein
MAINTLITPAAANHTCTPKPSATGPAIAIPKREAAPAMLPTAVKTRPWISGATALYSIAFARMGCGL